jgi:hypothetical protein
MKQKFERRHQEKSFKDRRIAAGSPQEVRAITNDDCRGAYDGTSSYRNTGLTRCPSG